MKIKGLLIDIDDTLIRFRPNIKNDTASLMDVLKQAGNELGSMTIKEVEKRIDFVKKNIDWWCWADFIKELELDEDIFWDYAYKKEMKYLEPSEPDLVKSLQILKNAGLKLFITSNNPNKGIKHKLRLANISNQMQTKLFTKLLGVTEM